MKVARINFTEFLKIYRDLAEKSDSGHHGRRTRFPASSDRALTFQDCRSGYGGFKNHLGSTNGGRSRRERPSEACGTGELTSSDDGLPGCSDDEHCTFLRFWGLLKPLVGSPWPGNGRKQQNGEAAHWRNFRRLLLLPQVAAGHETDSKR